jgi:sarcosine oxidase subunit beta
MPFMGRLRLLRQWAGIQDMTPDGSPYICTTPVEGLFLNGGWCYQGFKATPASGLTFAHTMATGVAHDLNKAYALDRLMQAGDLDEHGSGLWTYHQ